MTAHRRTIVVHTKVSGHMIRVAAARSGANGEKVMTMGQLAGRLAGGFLQPIDPEKLQEAIRAALATLSLGEFDAIKDLPGIQQFFTRLDCSLGSLFEQSEDAQYDIRSVDGGQHARQSLARKH